MVQKRNPRPYVTTEVRTLVHGRIYYEKKPGCGLEVRMERAKGETLGSTITDDGGYYSFILDTESAESLEKESPAGITLSIYDREGVYLGRKLVIKSAKKRKRTQLKE